MPKISELSEALEADVDKTDILIINDGSTTKRVSVENFLKGSEDSDANFNNATISGNLTVDGVLVTANPSFTGAVMAFAMDTAPAGWIACDGSAISRTTYSDLFSAIGTTWGEGDGTSTFNVPDFRGSFLRGYDDGSRSDGNGDPDAGTRSFGDFQNDQFESHSHSLESRSTGETENGLRVGGSGFERTTGLTGGDETRPKNYAILYCIKS